MSVGEEEDFNQLLDGIVLTEENLNREGYEEGLEVGRLQGKQEGYQLGYTKGVQLGNELAKIYAAVVYQQTQKHTVKVQRVLQQLRENIDNFPRDNNQDRDIIGAVENIRSQYKRAQVLTAGKIQNSTNILNESVFSSELESGSSKDLSF